MLKGVLVIMLLRQHNLPGLDRVVDVLEILLVEVLASVNTAQISSEIFQLHAIGCFDVRIVLIRVQHDYRIR